MMRGTGPGATGGFGRGAPACARAGGGSSRRVAGQGGRRSGRFARALVAAALALAWSACATDTAPRLDPSASAAAFEHRSLRGRELQRFIEGVLGHPVTPWPPRSWDLSTLTAAALYFRPELAAARARTRKAEAAVVTAGARPNPTLDFTPLYTVNPGNLSPWVVTPSLGITIEFPGRRRARIERASHRLTAARLEFATAAWTVRGRLAQALARLAGERRRLELLEAKQHSARRWVEALEERLAAGAASRPQVLEAKARLARVEVDRARARAALRRTRQAIARLVGVAPRALAGVELAAPEGPAASPLPPLADLREVALTHRTDIGAALARYDAACAAWRQELLRRYPDLHLGPGYEFDQGSRRWMLGFRVELPMFHQNQGPIAEAKAALDEAAALVLARQGDVIAAVAEDAADVTARRREWDRAKAYAAARRRVVEATRTAYRLGAAGRLDVLRAELTAADAELAEADAETAFREALLRLEATIQSPLGPEAGPVPGARGQGAPRR